MIYPSNFEQKIGFDRIREWTAGRCATQSGCDKVYAAAYTASLNELEEQLNLTHEMRNILMMEEGFPDTGYVDVLPYLKDAHIEGSYMEPLQLFDLKRALDTLGAIIHFFKKSDEADYPFLKKMMSRIVIYPAIVQRIDVILNKHGAIRDNASPELHQLRRALIDKQTQVSRKIQSILKTAQSDGIVDEDAAVSVRDGRIVIPVTAANKRKLKGLVYDESATGKTVFIEPLAVVELNNEIKELQYAEQREIIKILKTFTLFLQPYLEDVKVAADLLCEIDFNIAKAQLAISMSAVKPLLDSKPRIHLLKARHPLLEQALRKERKEIVPLNLQLTAEKHILLISGPNAGGKSVCLKTVGLLQYMLQCGFLIPASENSEMGLFDDIFIDIGDEQSLENDLSTYSSHLYNMKYFFKNATNKTLILIDEFGTGTEPAAGGSIAEAVLTKLTERGSFAVITTHYTNLKYYAATTSGTINGAMQFDVQKIQPLFYLETGIPGNSFAFELARKIGLPEEVVKLAEEKAGEQYVNIERNLRDIARNKRYWEEKRSRIKQTDKHLTDITSRYENELSELQQLRKTIIQQARDEAASLLAEANKRIERTILEIKEAQAEKERTKVARKNVNELREKLQSDEQDETARKIARKMEQLKQRQERRAQRQPKEAEERENRTKKEAEQILQKGDKVRLKGQDAVGEILKIADNQATVGFGSMITNLPTARLERVSNNEYKKEVRHTPAVSSELARKLSERKLYFKPIIDVRGQRAEEALNNVSSFMDDAFMVGASEVKILHGKGNGILREEIRKLLRTFAGVATVEDEHVESGGAGVTVVKMD